MKTFYQFEIALHFLVSTILSLISVSMFQVQMIAGIVFLIGGLFYLLCCFLVIYKINILDDRLVAYKLLAKNSISFKNINGLTEENRHFVGEGKLSTRKALVIAYTEHSGYGGELVLTYNSDLHHYLENQLGHVYER
ncbi:hypothetical protein WCX49_04245 [Sulfurimonas sp. HSL-1656]|uniref:hypothetical protein n=1 Tax=Thiomicrolovo subterrani TaxID=3131934 RepID=UPI0031F99E8A